MSHAEYSKRQASTVDPARSPINRARRSLAVTFFLTGFIFATWAARLPAIKQDLDLRDSELAIALVGLNAGAIIGLQLGGILVPRIGSRPALRLSLPLFALALIALAQAWNLTMLTIALIASAIVNSVIDVAMNAHGITVEQRAGKPLLSGLHAMHPFGGIIASAITAVVLARSVSTDVHFAIVAITVAIIAVIGTRGLFPASVERAGLERSSPQEATSVIGWFRGWSRRLLLFGLLAFAVTLAEGGILDWGAVYLRESTGASNAVAAAGVAAFLTAMTAGRLLGDRIHRQVGPVRAVQLGALVAGPGFGAALLLGSTPAGLLGMVLIGAGLSYLLPTILSVAGNEPDAPSAEIVARVSTLGYLGSFVGPALIGALAGGLSLSVALALLALLVSTLIVGARALRA